MVFCPEQLLKVILAHIHYMPDHWQGNAHRYETRDEFAQLFQYKAVSHAGKSSLCTANIYVTPRAAQFIEKLIGITITSEIIT